jgi:hypothetical protein
MEVDPVFARQWHLRTDATAIAARMRPADGAADDYRLPTNVNEALAIAGDGVVVPVVRWIAAHLLEPILQPNLARRAA